MVAPTVVRAPSPLLADQAAEYARVWDSFQERATLSHHRREWGEWVAGRSPHLLLLARPRDPRVLAGIGGVQRRLAHVRALELHPPDFLHLSLQSLGFLAPASRPARVGEVDQAWLLAAIRGLGDALERVAPVRVRVGATNGFYSCVFLEVHSGGGLQALRQAIRVALGPRILGIDPYPGYLFHLTVGFFGADAWAPSARAAITPLRQHALGEVVVDEVLLVALPTDQRIPFPALEPLASFRLRG